MLGFSTVLTTLVGTVIGAVKDVWMMNQKAKAAEHMALLRAAGVVTADRQRATSMTNPGVQFTRRIIVVAFMAILLTPIYLIVQDPNTVFHVPVQVAEGGFSLLFGLISGSPREGVEYVELHGYVYVLAIMDLVGFIVGYYFGNGGTNARY
jgi:hypothetical protein